MAFRFLTAGESHGEALTAVIDGVPAGLPLTKEHINEDLARRQRGYGRGGRMKIERHQVYIASGVRFAVTLGSPISLTIVLGRVFPKKFGGDSVDEIRRNYDAYLEYLKRW